MPNSGRNVLITGASTGIGEASALLLASQGFRVFAAVRRDEDARKLKDANSNIETLLMDVTDSAAVSRAAVDVAVVTGGKLHGLVNNSVLRPMKGGLPGRRYWLKTDFFHS